MPSRARSREELVSRRCVARLHCAGRAISAMCSAGRGAEAPSPTSASQCPPCAYNANYHPPSSGSAARRSPFGRRASAGCAEPGVAGIGAPVADWGHRVGDSRRAHAGGYRTGPRKPTTPLFMSVADQPANAQFERPEPKAFGLGLAIALAIKQRGASRPPTSEPLPSPAVGRALYPQDPGPAKRRAGRARS